MKIPEDGTQKHRGQKYAAGIAIAVVLLVLVVAFAAVPWGGKQAGSDGNGMDLSQLDLSEAARKPPTPQVEYILQARADLELDDEQVTRLQAINQRETEELKPIEADLEEAAGKLDAVLQDRRLEEPETDTTASESEVEEAAKSMKELSDRAIGVRERYWAEAADVLREPQRKKLQDILLREWEETLKGLMQGE